MTDKQTLSYTGTWVMVSDRLPTQLFSDRRPDQLEIVWLHYTGKVVEGREYTATAFYVAKKFTIEADPYCEGEYFISDWTYYQYDGDEDGFDKEMRSFTYTDS